MKSNDIKGQVLLSAVFLILGILLATSFVSQQAQRASVPSSRKTELIGIIRDLEGEREKLKAELQKQRNQMTAFEKQAAADQGVLSSFTKRLDGVKFATGLTRVEGPGISITIGDSQSIPPNKNPNDYIVHDTDLRIIVNALWSAGAEAIVVNNERLVSTSAIRCAGTMILVNSRRLAAPYQIKAIGNSERLFSGLKQDKDASRLLNEVAKTYNLLVSIERESDLTLPAYKGSLGIEYAQVAEKSEN